MTSTPERAAAAPVLSVFAIRDELAEIASEAGPNAWIDASINPGRPEATLVSATLYPSGLAERHVIHGRGICFASAIADLRMKWEADRIRIDRNLVRRIALSVIEITADQGECTDAALRGAGFSQAQIARLGGLACEEASRLAAGGPFSIITSGGANTDA